MKKWKETHKQNLEKMKIELLTDLTAKHYTKIDLHEICSKYQNIVKMVSKKDGLD
jgi:hypothetical protein